MTTEFQVANVLIEVFKKGYFSVVRKSSLKAPEESVVLLDERPVAVESVFKDIVGFWYSENVDIVSAQAFSSSSGRIILMIVETTSGWLRGWYVNNKEIVSDAKVIRIPFFHDYFFVYKP